MVNNNAFFGLIIPFGISLMAVRGLSASNFLSRYRLKAIAALRANTIHSITFRKRNNISFVEAGAASGFNASEYILVVHSPMLNELVSHTEYARKKPISAKGMAKMVWENLISDK